MSIIDTTLHDPERSRRPGNTPGVPEVVLDYERTPGPPVDDSSTALREGECVGRYRIIERLGAGGMGVVYRAHDPQLDRDVALKLLRSRPGRDEQLASRMLREAKAAAKIRHPNVVTVYDAGEVDGRVFIAMELMHGIDLGKWFALRPGWAEVVRVMLQAGQGLRAAHEVGLVHRDFKPDNVVLEDDGTVKVLDFGLARPAYDEATQSRMAEELADQLGSGPARQLEKLTLTGKLVGTPAYMAPEQYLHGQLDARTDQFSFCVALFMGVYGYRPFGGRTYAALTVNVINGNLELPEDPSMAPARLLAALRKGLATKPDDRFASMDELINELQAILDEESGGREARRRRWLLAGFGLAAIIGAVVMTRAIDARQGGVPVEPPGLFMPAAETGSDPDPDTGSDSDSDPDPAPGLELADGHGQHKPVDGPTLWIEPTRLRVVLGPDEPLQDIALIDGRVPALREGPGIPELLAALEPVRGESEDPLTLHVDRRVPFETVVRTLYSGARIGFERFEFAVRSDGEVRVFEARTPSHFESDVQLRRRLALELAVEADRVRVGAREWAPNAEIEQPQPRRWSLDGGAGSCELPLDPSAGLARLAGLATELCAHDGLSTPIIISADNDVAWQQITTVIAAALPSDECAGEIVIEAGSTPAPDCAAPVAIAALDDEPQYRRWCFINSRLRSKKECRSTRAACIAEAKHWVDNPQKSCKGEP